MDSVDLGGPIGSVPAGLPASFAVRNDIVSSWGGGTSRPHLARLCAAAVGVCCAIPGVPKYKVAQGDPIGYGATVLDFLFSRGVLPGAVYAAGPQLIEAIADSFPTEDGVRETADFIEAPGGS